jgi:hypothetical protein
VRLDRKADALQGGDNGAVIIPGKGADSPLVRLTAGLEADRVMPPKGGRLTAEQVGLLRAWVDQGAKWPDAGEAADPLDWWPFRPLARPAPPKLSAEDEARVRNPVDRFVLAKVREQGLAPSSEADRRTLIRRLSFDLLGLPPTPEDTDAFQKDTSPDAYERLVDRLLASPAYGERWARHWLDLVRYAETNGYEFDTAKPHVWRYRDYVIASLNADKPYDRFVKEQLAGDELDPATPETLVATGYYRLGPWDGGAPDRLQATYDELDDILSTTGQVFLGLTVQCARWHDHKVARSRRRTTTGCWRSSTTSSGTARGPRSGRSATRRTPSCRSRRSPHSRSGWPRSSGR